MAKTNPLKGIKASQLTWDEPAPDARMAMAVPEWVKTAIGFLRDKLAEMGFDLTQIVTELGDKALHELIAKLEKAPPSFQKWLIMAALNYLHKMVHSDELRFATLKGE
jgi:hypothetical protein